MSQFIPVYGTIHSITPMTNADQTVSCNLMFTVSTSSMGTVNFMVTPNTYVKDQKTFRPGDSIVAFYDSQAPVPLIYPPQYEALLMAEHVPGQSAAFDFFDESYLSYDGTLRLNLSAFPRQNSHLSNGQYYMGFLGNKYLLVIYGASTRSIPAVTSPEEIIVFCTEEQTSSGENTAVPLS